jgi:hypothetical protein
MLQIFFEFFKVKSVNVMEFQVTCILKFGLLQGAVQKRKGISSGEGTQCIELTPTSFNIDIKYSQCDGENRA